MRISELSSTTGVPVATIKYYLREGLLPQGHATSRTQATYDDTHVDRIRLIRALTESAGLSLARVRVVVDALTDPPDRRHDLLGIAQEAATPDPVTHASEQWTNAARDFIERRGWQIRPADPLIALLGTQLSAFVDAGTELGDGSALDAWADAAEIIGRADLSTVPPEPADALRQVVLGTVLGDPIIATLRRLAQQDASARYGSPDSPPDRRS